MIERLSMLWIYLYSFVIKSYGIVVDSQDFKSMFKERSDLLVSDDDLNSTYHQAYEIWLKRERNESMSNEIKTSTRSGLLEFDFDELLKKAVEQNMLEEGISFRAYLLPLSFFLFSYLAGFLITLPLIASIFTGTAETTFIPLFTTQYTIPIVVVQWGFLGGFVYTSISLLTRFLRNDLIPRVYLLASLRLLLSAVVSVIIYLFYLLTSYASNVYSSSVAFNNTEIPPQMLLLCFLAGVAPVQILINFADSQISRIYKGWKRKDIAGNKLLTQLEGINSITADRLNEEGVDVIQQMALCYPKKLSKKTKFPEEIIEDWKDQAILTVLSGDVIVTVDNSKTKHLDKILDERYGIRRISVLLEIWKRIKNSPEEQKSFFGGLGVIYEANENFDWLRYLFKNIIYHGSAMMVNTRIHEDAMKWETSVTNGSIDTKKEKTISNPKEVVEDGKKVLGPEAPKSTEA